MVWLAGAAGHHVTTQGPRLWPLEGTTSPPQPCLAVLSLVLIFWGLVFWVSLVFVCFFNFSAAYKTAITRLRLLPGCARVLQCHMPKRKGKNWVLDQPHVWCLI